jgi:hypothetical protein
MTSEYTADSPGAGSRDPSEIAADLARLRARTTELQRAAERQCEELQRIQDRVNEARDRADHAHYLTRYVMRARGRIH